MWLDSPIIDFPLLVGNELERLGFPRILASPAITMGERLVGVNIDDKVPLEVATYDFSIIFYLRASSFLSVANI